MGYPVPGDHNDRDVLVVHAHLADARHPASVGEDDRETSTVTGLRLPADAEVVIDAEYGFLHRMTGLVDGQPLMVTELLDLMVDPPLDEDVFRIDPSRFQVIEHPEWERPTSPGVRSARGSPAPPPVAWDDLGVVANDLQDDLEARVRACLTSVSVDSPTTSCSKQSKSTTSDDWLVSIRYPTVTTTSSKSSGLLGSTPRWKTS